MNRNCVKWKENGRQSSDGIGICGGKCATPNKFVYLCFRKKSKEYNRLISNIIQITPARHKNRALLKRDTTFSINDIEWQHLLVGKKNNPFNEIHSNHHRLWIVWMWMKVKTNQNKKKRIALNCNQFISKFIIYLPYENTVALISTNTHSGHFVEFFFFNCRYIYLLIFIEMTAMSWLRIIKITKTFSYQKITHSKNEN